MSTSASRGAYYHDKSRDYLIAQGFHVESLQVTGWHRTAQGFVPFKRDICGADLLAIGPEKIVFVQIKGGDSWRDDLAAARRLFATYPLSAQSEQWILGWEPHARTPEILIVATGPQRADHPVEIPPRRRPKSLPLFSARLA
jgi:hypothetical protein